MKPLILVVEDNPADVQLLELALREVGLEAELVTFDDGGHAIAWVRSCGSPDGGRCPDLAIVDLNLPRYDGVEILAAFRGNKVLENVPALVMSSSTSPRDEARVRGLEKTQYLTKPVELDQYLEVGKLVRRLLGM